MVLPFGLLQPELPLPAKEALDRSRNESLRPDEPASNEATVQSFDSTSSAEDEDARHGTLMGAPRDDSRDENSDRATADTAYNVRNRNQALPAIRRDLSQLRCRVEQQIDGVLLSVQNTFDDLEQRIDRACWPDNNNNRPHVSKSNHIDDRGRGRGNVRRNRVGSRSRHHPSRRHRHNQDPIAGAERDIQEIQARLDLVDPHAHRPRHARARHHRYRLEPLLIVELDDSFDSAFGALDWISTFSALARGGFRRPPQRRHPRQCERRGRCVSLDRSHHRGRRDDPTFNFHNDVFGQASHAQLSVDSASDLGPAESDSSGSEWLVRSRISRRRRQATPHPSRRTRRPRWGQIDGYLSESPTRDVDSLRCSPIPVRTRNSVAESMRTHRNEQCQLGHRAQPKGRGARAGPSSHQCLGCLDLEDGHACQPSSSKNPFGRGMPLDTDDWEEPGEPGGNDGAGDDALGL